MYFRVCLFMKNCTTHTKRCSAAKQSNWASWLPGILIAILPKCPFCLMAYSGAVTLCSGNTLYPNAGGYSAYITVGLSLFILIIIYLNYKGKRTFHSLLITLSGVVLLLISQFIYINSYLYYGGVALLLFGIWYNGSFFYFYKKGKQKFRYTFLNSNKFEL